MADTRERINIDDLPPQQISEIYKQLDQEAQHFQIALQQLKVASAKYADSINCINNLCQSSGLVPLTSSLYVYGDVQDDEVMVDIGTGFFVCKGKNEGIGFYKRKVEFVKKQMENVEATLEQKVNAREGNNDIISNISCWASFEREDKAKQSIKIKTLIKTLIIDQVWLPYTFFEVKVNFDQRSVKTRGTFAWMLRNRGIQSLSWKKNKCLNSQQLKSRIITETMMKKGMKWL